jgi:N-acetylglutamate synthase-like GNAT family acetyltransferase
MSQPRACLSFSFTASSFPENQKTPHIHLQAGFFKKFGFIPIDRAEFPPKIRADCIHFVKFQYCAEAAMLKKPV